MELKDLEVKLAELKTSLETTLTQKAKDEITLQLKTVTDELKALKDAAPKADPKVAELENIIKELKAAADANQPVIDAFVKNPDKKIEKQRKSFAEGLTEGIKENEDKLRNMKKGQSVSFELKAVEDMTFATSFSTADVSVSTLRPGIIELPKRKLHIRQLLSGGSMGNSTYTYVKEVTGDEGPETAAEGALKNQFDLSLQEVDSPSQYIAGFLSISRKMLDDVQGMTTFLQSRLPELLLREEDDQLLNGDGTSPNISGITDAGNFTAASGSATIDIEQLVQAISQLEGYDREANGILLNPADYWRLALTKGQTSGDYTMPAGIVVVGEDGVMRIGGVPVFRSTACTLDKFIVGDWVMGANLITREAPRVEFFFEDSTNVRYNKVTVRVEERIAFPIYGDNYFIYGDFGNES